MTISNLTTGAEIIPFPTKAAKRTPTPTIPREFDLGPFAGGFDIGPLVDARSTVDRLRRECRDNPGADALLGIASDAIRDAGFLLALQVGASK